MMLNLLYIAIYIMTSQMEFMYNESNKITFTVAVINKESHEKLINLYEDFINGLEEMEERHCNDTKKFIEERREYIRQQLKNIETYPYKVRGI